MYYLYVFHNPKLKKFYIGQTCEPYKRENRHRNELKKGCHHSIKLQKAYDDGIDFSEFWEFMIVKEFDNKKDVDRYEEYYINKCYDSERCCNVSKFASGGDLISMHPNNEEIRKDKSRIGKMIWENMSKEEYERRRSLVSGKNNPRYNENSANNKKRIRLSNRTKLQILSNSKRKSRAKCIVIKDILFLSTTEASNALNVSRDFLERRANRDDIKDVRWATDEDIVLNIYDKDNPQDLNGYLEEIRAIVRKQKQQTKRVKCEGVVYDSIKEAAKHYNVDSSAITYRLKSEKEKWKDFYYID